MMKQGLILIGLVMSGVVFAINPGAGGHAKGDVIAVKTDDQIAAFCDFSKQIVMSQFNTLCVYNGSNPASNDMLSKG